MANTIDSQTISLLHDSDDQVLVDDGKGDRIVLDCKQAVLACFAFDRCNVPIQREMTTVFELVEEWLKSHRERISAAYMNIKPSGSLLLVVMQKEKAFDAELSDNLSEFDLRMANDEGFEVVELDVLAIPPVSEDCARSFLSSGEVFAHA